MPSEASSLLTGPTRADNSMRQMVPTATGATTIGSISSVRPILSARPSPTVSIARPRPRLICSRVDEIANTIVVAIEPTKTRSVIAFS